jgi:hypothetical protein
MLSHKQWALEILISGVDGKDATNLLLDWGKGDASALV